MFNRTSTITLGENRGAARVYISGKWLGRAGFDPGSKITVHFGDDGVSIRKDAKGKRVVSGKLNNTVGVIDITNAELAESLDNASTLQLTCGPNLIVISPSRIEILKRERTAVATEASVFTGGGLLTLAAANAGFVPVIGVEINDAYAEIAERNHPTMHMFNMSIEQVPWERVKPGPIGLMTLGIPCEPYTKIRTLDRGGQIKRDKSLAPEAHELGDMTFWGLRAVEALNPYTVVIEEVPKFLQSGAGCILTHVLKRLYPHVESKILNPLDYGSLTGRERACVVASNEPIVWPATVPRCRTLGEIFDTPAELADEWFDRDSKAWLFNHWEKQTGKGNGFEPPKLTANSKFAGTIKKRYMSQQGDNPVVAHPTKPGVFRWFTLNEIKRLHGVPDTYWLGTSKTLAGECLGQGVVVDLFQKVISSVASWISKAVKVTA